MTELNVNVTRDSRVEVSIGSEGSITLSVDEANWLRDNLGIAVAQIHADREPKAKSREETIDGVAVMFHLPASRSFGPAVYFGPNQDMNTAQRCRGYVDGQWDVYNRSAGRSGRKRYTTAGHAVAHRMGISGHKGTKFARALNERLHAFMIEAVDGDRSIAHRTRGNDGSVSRV